jgi:hypothetical protein
MDKIDLKSGSFLKRFQDTDAERMPAFSKGVIATEVDRVFLNQAEP